MPGSGQRERLTPSKRLAHMSGEGGAGCVACASPCMITFEMAASHGFRQVDVRGLSNLAKTGHA